MINLLNDYCGIAHPKIMEALNNNLNNTYPGYGMDVNCENAKKKIQKIINNDQADVHFFVGGTITNKILIAHALRPSEAVICTEIGHINVHETGAIEETGHKVLPVKSHDGKIKSEDIIKKYNEHVNEHMVKPRMVYISNATELGTVYNYDELSAISKTCHELGMYLYLDGARLAVALTSKHTDLKIEDIASLVDAFYIGGTKNGLLFGEALIILNDKLKKDFRYSLKHFGGMLAKSFINGIMFDRLFSDGLFYEIGNLQNRLAQQLYLGLQEIGVEFVSIPQTNQLFLKLNNEIVSKLADHIMFEVWEQDGDNTIIRFVTHYMTTEEDVQKTINIVKELLK